VRKTIASVAKILTFNLFMDVQLYFDIALWANAAKTNNCITACRKNAEVAFQCDSGAN
jgi:hypothetical protein